MTFIETVSRGGPLTARSKGSSVSLGPLAAREPSNRLESGALWELWGLLAAGRGPGAGRDPGAERGPGAGRSPVVIFCTVQSKSFVLFIKS